MGVRLNSGIALSLALLSASAFAKVPCEEEVLPRSRWATMWAQVEPYLPLIDYPYVSYDGRYQPLFPLLHQGEELYSLLLKNRWLIPYWESLDLFPGERIVERSAVGGLVANAADLHTYVLHGNSGKGRVAVRFAGLKRSGQRSVELHLNYVDARILPAIWRDLQQSLAQIQAEYFSQSGRSYQVAVRLAWARAGGAKQVQITLPRADRVGAAFLKELLYRLDQDPEENLPEDARWRFDEDGKPDESSIMLSGLDQFLRVPGNYAPKLLLPAFSKRRAYRRFP